MGVYIKGMEMPKKYPVTVTIFPDGISVAKTISGRRFTATAAPVPPHGNLIDRDALPWEKQGLMLTCPDEWGIEARYIESAPVIIPAEEGET